MVKNSKGVSLIALIITIIVTIMIASISYVVNTDALNSSVEARFKADLRGVQDRLKIYHEDANLELFEYRSQNLQWDGISERATSTGKVEDAQNDVSEESRREDTAIFIFKEIPTRIRGKIAIENGKLIMKQNSVSNDEKTWAEEMQIEVK